MFNRRKWDVEADVVAIGSGLGGLGAAIVTHDNKRRAVVIEKARKLGGIGAYSGGEVFVPANHLQAAAGIEDSRDEGLRYLQFLAAGYADPELQAALLDGGREAVRWFGEHAGVRWKIIKDFPDYYYPTAPGTAARGRYLEVELIRGHELGDWRKKTFLSPHVPVGITHDELFAWGGFTGVMSWDFNVLGQRMTEDWRGFGPGMMAYFVKAALVDRPINAYLETAARELILEDGAVIGVRCERATGKDAKDFLVRAHKGVVLATGGYDWHPSLPLWYEQLPEWRSMCLPSVAGDGLVMAGEAGAAVAAVPAHNLGLMFGYQVSGEEHEGKPLYRASWDGGSPHAIWVNRAGKRFADESFYKDYAPKTHFWDGIKQQQPNFPPYLIFDSNYREKYPLGRFLPTQDLPPSLVARAPTLRELGAQLGIDGEELEKTVARFNQFAAEGVDRDFGRGTYPWAAMMTGDRRKPGNPNLGALDKPPFYGLRLTVVSAGINAGGLRVNADAQVMHLRGQPIPGLYAVGNAAAPLDIGAGYQSGLSNLRGIVGGYRAAKHAVSPR
jgi:3-oxosteroid 1-dehydrogenase